MIIFALSLAACGGSGSKPAATATSAPSATAAPAPTPEIAILDKIVWANAVDPVTFAPIGHASSFAPDAAAIHAAVSVKNITPGLTLSASWTYNGTALRGVGSSIVASQPMPSGWVEFHLSQAPGQLWPTGTYKITITQLGSAPVSSSVAVKRPGS